jgi:hypothetical protein
MDADPRYRPHEDDSEETARMKTFLRHASTPHKSWRMELERCQREQAEENDNAR